MTLFEEYAMLVSNGNADLHKDLHGCYDDPQVMLLLVDFERKVKANLFSVFDEMAPEGLPDVCYKVADWWDGRKLQRRIVSAANRFELKDGGTLVIPGARHYSRDMAAVIDQVRDKLVNDHVHGDDQGFIDQWGEYHTREEAVIIATHAGQIDRWRRKGGPANELFSEDLY
jgi:hypothetical protein